MIAALLGNLIGSILASFITAVIIQYATKIAYKFKPPYWTAFKASVYANLSAFSLGLVFGFLLSDNPLSLIFLFLISLLLAIYIYGMTIKDLDGSPIGFKRGFIVILLGGLIGIAIWVLIMLIVGILNI